MAGGDLLYIFAFIILPTAVLVSCIWALIMLRNGALLPPRPVVTRQREVDPGEDDDATFEAMNPVEETGEHVIVEPAATATPPAAPAQIVAAPVAEAAPLAQRGDDANVAVTPTAASTVGEPPVDAHPVVERTQELSVLPAEAVDVGDEPLNDAAADVLEGVENPPAADPANVLMVPLDEPARPAAALTTPPADLEAAEPASDRPEAPPVTATTPRRPARRVAQLRPTEAEPARPRPRTGQRRGGRRAEE